MKKYMKAILFAVLPLVALMNCQNTSDSAGNDGGGDQKVPGTNTMTFKLNGAIVTMSGIAYTKGNGESFIGKQGEGRYIQIPSVADLTSGNFDKDSNPGYFLQYSENTQGTLVTYVSGANDANTTFAVTVSATEISGTFSGVVRRVENGNVTLVNVTEGSFRVNK